MRSNQHLKMVPMEGGVRLAGEIWNSNFAPLFMPPWHLHVSLWEYTHTYVPVSTSVLKRPEEGIGRPLYHSLPILLRRDLSLKPGTPIFLVSLDASKLQQSSKSSLLGIRVIGAYRVLSLLCGCWHLDSGPHCCSSSTLNPSLAFAWHLKHNLNVIWFSGWRLSVTNIPHS